MQPHTAVAADKMVNVEQAHLDDSWNVARPNNNTEVQRSVLERFRQKRKGERAALAALQHAWVPTLPFPVRVGCDLVHHVVSVQEASSSISPVS